MSGLDLSELVTEFLNTPDEPEQDALKQLREMINTQPYLQDCNKCAAAELMTRAAIDAVIDHTFFDHCVRMIEQQVEVDNITACTIVALQVYQAAIDALLQVYIEEQQ